MLCVVVFSVVARYPVDLHYYYFSINNTFLVVCYSHKINPASHLSSLSLFPFLQSLVFYLFAQCVYYFNC